MKRVLKSEITQSEIHKLVEIEMRRGSRILHAAEQRAMSGSVTIWYEVDDDQPRVRRSIAVRGTGQELPHDTSAFIATVVTCGGMLVWHLYDLGEKPL